MNATFRDAITNAVLYLAGVCDYARSWDGQGFNKPDSHLGHDLARRAQHRTLTEEELHAAWALCWKYASRQLAAAQITLPTEQEARELFGAAEPPLLPRTPGVIQFIDSELDVAFPYDPAKVGCIRDLQRRYGGSGFAERNGIKSWRLHPTVVDELVRSFPTFERWFDSAEVRQQAALLASASEVIKDRDMSVAMPAKPSQQGTVSLHGLHLRIEFPYDPELVQQIKRLRQQHGGPGFQHDASGKYWLLTLASTEALHATFTHFEWSEEAQAVLQRRMQQQEIYKQLPAHFR